MTGIPPQVLAQLIAPASDDTTTIVLMTCGISGSGKSTLAKSICDLENFQYTRSIEGDSEKSREDLRSKSAPTEIKCSQITASFEVITVADRGATGVNAHSPHHDPITAPTHEQVLLRLSRESREYIRLSIDQYIWDHHGRYGIDYPPEKYSEYQSEASDELDKLFVQLLRRNSSAPDKEVQARRPLTIVLDYSFATKADRDDVREIVEREGGRCVLLYFAISGNRQAIRERVTGRKAKRDVESGSCDGDNAFEVTDEVLDTYFATFQVPRGEGEIVIH